MNESQLVHYFVMGPRAGWASTCAWPPPNLAPEPLALYLRPAAVRCCPRCLRCVACLKRYF
jgi:hypothetical protein